MILRPQPALLLSAVFGLAGIAHGYFVCDPWGVCAAEDPSNPVDECNDSDECNDGERCCVDGCPRLVCSAHWFCLSVSPMKTLLPTRGITRAPAHSHSKTFSPTPTPAPIATDETGTYCLTEEECEEASQGYDSFAAGVFATTTKGCFAKNNKAFFAMGNAEEMQETELPGIQERIWCDDSTPTPGGEDVTCVTEEECKAMSSNMGFVSFAPGDYPTKGCFSKNGKAYFSPGSEGDMSETELPGLQARIWCTYQTACLTMEDCSAKSEALGFKQVEQGTFQTKGCFSKNGAVYFSPGTNEEMAETDLPGVQERIWCDDEQFNVAAFAMKLKKAGAISESDQGVISAGSTIRIMFTCISAIIAEIATAHLML